MNRRKKVAGVWGQNKRVAGTWGQGDTHGHIRGIWGSHKKGLKDFGRRHKAPRRVKA